MYIFENQSDIITPEEIQDTPSSFISFNEISPESNGRFEIPFEYAVIYSGANLETFRLEHSHESDIKNTNSLSEFMSSRVFPGILRDSYYQNLLGTITPYRLFSDSIGILNSLTIQLFHELFQNGYDKSSIDMFLSHMNHLRELLSIIEPQSDFAERFTSVFHEKKKHQEESIGIFPLRSGKLG